MSLCYAIFTARHSFEIATEKRVNSENGQLSQHFLDWWWMNVSEFLFLFTDIQRNFKQQKTHKHIPRFKCTHTHTKWMQQFEFRCGMMREKKKKNKKIQTFTIFQLEFCVSVVNESGISVHINNFKLCNTNLSNTLARNERFYFPLLFRFSCIFHLKWFRVHRSIVFFFRTISPSF